MSDTAAMPFTVPEHDLMYGRIPGKRANTVLTIERQIYTVRICEYTEPLSYQRFWCFETVGDAVVALANYVEDDAAPEPSGWLKATDRPGRDGYYRVRRAHIVDGERVITEDMPQ